MMTLIVGELCSRPLLTLTLSPLCEVCNEARNALDAGCRPRSAMVTVKRPPQARQPVTGPTTLALPQLPRCGSLLPERIQVLLVAQSIHRLPEAAMHPCA